MAQNRYLAVVDDGNVRQVVYVPTGEILMKFVMIPQAAVLDNIKLTEDLLKEYDSYLRAVFRQ